MLYLSGDYRGNAATPYHTLYLIIASITEGGRGKKSRIYSNVTKIKLPNNLGSNLLDNYRFNAWVFGNMVAGARVGGW